RVEERTEELPRNVLERELEVGVLDRRVMAGFGEVPRELLAAGLQVGVFDQPLRRIARPRRRQHRVERAGEVTGDADARLGRALGNLQRDRLGHRVEFYQAVRDALSSSWSRP